MKPDILFISAIIGIGLALFLEKFFKPLAPSAVVSTLNTPTLTGDPIRDYMNSHYG